MTEATRVHDLPGHGDVEQRRVKTFAATAFRNVIQEIERLTYDFASKTYRALTYGNTISESWSAYRAKTEGGLARLGLEGHLRAIDEGLRSPTAESWRSATLACRNLLYDVAAALWKDDRPTYDHLLGEGINGKLQVDKEHQVNRLAAYLHQKGLRGGDGKFLREELESLVAGLRALHSLQSAGKGKVMTQEEAQAIALRTYIFFGELATKTDLQPIKQYGKPAVEAQENSPGWT